MGSWARRARAKKVSKLEPFARARAARPGPLSPQGPLSKESVLEAFSVGGGGIKWPVQHRFCFFRGFTWTGHFIEKKISLEKFLRVNGVLGAPRARQKGLKIGAIRARARGATRTPFTPRTPFKGKCVRGILCWGRGYKVASPT